jgi:hypothetical protein
LIGRSGWDVAEDVGAIGALGENAGVAQEFGQVVFGDVEVALAAQYAANFGRCEAVGRVVVE